MIIKSITISLKRDVKHRRFQVSQCHCSLTAEVEIDNDGDLEKAYEELHRDVVVIVEDIEREERENFRESKRKEENK